MPKPNATSQSASQEAEDRAKRLAVMQSNASSVEEERKQRVVEANAREERNLQADDKLRSGKGRFVSGLHNQVGAIGLGDNLRRKGGVFLESEA